MGTLYNLELAPNDPISEEFVELARTCLVKDHFLVKNTLAGVQTLNVMAHFNLFVHLLTNARDRANITERQIEVGMEMPRGRYGDLL